MLGRLELDFHTLSQTEKLASSAELALKNSPILLFVLLLSSPSFRPSIRSSSRVEFPTGLLSLSPTTLPASSTPISLLLLPRLPTSFLLLVRATFSTAPSSFLLGRLRFASNSYLGEFVFLAKNWGLNSGESWPKPSPLLPSLLVAGMVVDFALNPLSFSLVKSLRPYCHARVMVSHPP